MYDKGSFQKMNQDLMIDWQTQLNTDLNVNIQWETIKAKIISATDKHIPSYQTTEDHLWKKGKIPLKPETRKEIRKNIDYGRGHMKQNKTKRLKGGKHKGTKLKNC